MSKVNVDTWEPESGTAATLMATGDTVTLPSGAILSVASGGDINVASGVLDSSHLTQSLRIRNHRILMVVQRLLAHGVNATYKQRLLILMGLFRFHQINLLLRQGLI